MAETDKDDLISIIDEEPSAANGYRTAHGDEKAGFRRTAAGGGAAIHSQSRGYYLQGKST